MTAISPSKKSMLPTTSSRIPAKRIHPAQRSPIASMYRSFQPALPPTFGPRGGFPLQPARQQAGGEQRAETLRIAADVRLDQLTALPVRVLVGGRRAPQLRVDLLGDALVGLERPGGRVVAGLLRRGAAVVDQHRQVRRHRLQEPAGLDDLRAE